MSQRSPHPSFLHAPRTKHTGRESSSCERHAAPQDAKRTAPCLPPPVPPFLLSSPLGLELLRLIARRGELFQTRRGRVLLRHGLPVGRGGRGEPGHRRAAARTPSAVQTATPRGSSAGAAGRGAPHGLGGRAARLCDDTRQGRAHADARGTRGRAEGLERARSAHGPRAATCPDPRRISGRAGVGPAVRGGWWERGGGQSHHLVLGVGRGGAQHERQRRHGEHGERKVRGARHPGAFSSARLGADWWWRRPSRGFRAQSPGPPAVPSAPRIHRPPCSGPTGGR